MRFYVHFKTYQKVISMFLVICFLIIPLSVVTLPKKASAICVPYVVPPIPNPLAVPVTTAMDPTKQVDRVQDGNTFFKNCILDGIATLIAKTIIQQLTKSIVTWINSGFKGNPSFVQNPGKFFGGVADKVAGQTIEGIAPFLCSPFKLNIQLALAQQATGSGNDLGCTLTDVEKNFSDFVGGTGGGGWDNWFQITQIPQNNPYGAMLIAKAQVSNNVESAQGQYQQQLDWGSGFFSSESCPSGAAGNVFTGTPGEVNMPAGGGDGHAAMADPSNSENTGLASENISNNSLASIGSLGLLESLFGDTSKNNLAQVLYTENGTIRPDNAPAGRAYQSVVNGRGVNPINVGAMGGRTNVGSPLAGLSLGSSLNSNTHTNPNNPNDRQVYDANNNAVYGKMAGDNGCTIETPGAVINDQLENVLGSDLRGLEIAQSIDQIIAALVGQLMTQALGGIGGLFGGGSGGGGGGGGGNYTANVANNLSRASATIPDLPLTGACMPDKQTALIGETVTWTAYVPGASGSITYTWYGDEGLSGSKSTATTSYAINGNKGASVLVSTASDPTGQMIECLPNVQIGEASAIVNTPTISCAVSPDRASVNTPVTWQATVIGGTAPFVYSWHGDDGLQSTGQSTIKSYATASNTPKTAVVDVTDAWGHTYTHNCNNNVLVTP